MSGHGIIKTLSKPVNISILALLSTGPKYPRVLARLLGKSEAFIVRNLKELEREGLVESYWLHVSGRNVKMYRLKTRRLVISFSTGAVKVVAEDGSEKLLLSRGYSDPIPDPGLFVGRVREIEALQSAPGVSFVWGPMGIGKTSLAAVVAKTREAKLWINATQLTLPDEVVRRLSLFLADKGLPPPPAANPLDAAQPIAERLDALDALIVIDDFHKPVEKEGLYELLDRLDSSLNEASVIVLSREPPQMIPRKGVLLPLQPLSLEEAKALLEMLGAHLDPEAARWLYEAAGGNPGLLSAMAKLLAAGYTPEEIVSGGALDGILSKILASLDPHEYRVLAAASVFLSPPTAEEVSEVSGIRAADTYISRLASRGIVKVAEGRIIVHDAIKGYLERRDPDAAAHYHRALAKKLLDSGSRDDMFRAIYHYWRAGDYTAALDTLEKFSAQGLMVPSYYRHVFLQLLSSIPRAPLDPYYRLLLQFYKATAMPHEDAAQLLDAVAREACARGIHKLCARAHAAAAHELLAAGGEYAAHLEEALRAAEDWTGPPDTRFFIYLIRVLHRTGRVRRAIQVTERYLQAAVEAHDRAYAHHFLAVLYETLWRPEEALRHIEEAIRSYRETPILANLATALGDKGFLLYRMGRHREALEALRQATQLAETCGDIYAAAESMIDTAEVHVEMGDLEQATRILEEVEDRHGEALAHSPYLKSLHLLAAARLLAAQGRLKEAAATFAAACEGLKGRHSYHYARCLTYMAYLLANIDKDEACRLLGEAGRVYRAMGSDALAEAVEDRAGALCGKSGAGRSHR